MTAAEHRARAAEFTVSAEALEAAAKDGRESGVDAGLVADFERRAELNRIYAAERVKAARLVEAEAEAQKGRAA